MLRRAYWDNGGIRALELSNLLVGALSWLGPATPERAIVSTVGVVDTILEIIQEPNFFAFRALLTRQDIEVGSTPLTVSRYNKLNDDSLGLSMCWLTFHGVGSLLRATMYGM